MFVSLTTNQTEVTKAGDCLFTSIYAANPNVTDIGEINSQLKNLNAPKEVNHLALEGNQFANPQPSHSINLNTTSLQNTGLQQASELINLCKQLVEVNHISTPSFNNRNRYKPNGDKTKFFEGKCYNHGKLGNSAYTCRPNCIYFNQTVFTVPDPKTGNFINPLAKTNQINYRFTIVNLGERYIRPKIIYWFYFVLKWKSICLEQLQAKTNNTIYG